MTNTTIRVLGSLALAGGLLLTSGCGGGGEASQDAPPVASVTTAADSSGGPPAAPAAERPVDRSDLSEEESQALWAAWGQCLTDHGVPAPPPGKVIQSQNTLEDPQHAAAVAACASKQPENEREHSKRTDPEFAAKFRAFIQCIRDKGISVEPNGDGPGFSLTDDRQVARGMDVVSECDEKAFT